VATELNWEWESPPGSSSSRRQGVSHIQAAQACREKRGQWMRLREYPSAQSSSSTANVIRRGATPPWRPAGAFWALARTVEGRHYVYVRYVGEDQESERSAPDAPDGA
jgi:hypothetical protein